MKTQHSVLILLAFLAIYVIWGTTYLAILFGLQGFPPFILSALRFFSAGVILFAWCKFKGEQLPAKSIIAVCITSGCLMLLGGSGLVTWAEKYVTSGQAAIIIATEPFLFILFDKKRWAWYFSSRLIIAGLVIGFLGLLLFFRTIIRGTTVPFNMFIIAMLVLLVSAILWVIGSLYAKKKLVAGDSNLMTTSLQLMAAGIGSALVAAFTNEWQHFSFTAVSINAWGGLLYLVIFGSLIAYLAFTWLISIRPPALVSTHTYINPVVAILLGWLLADEQLSFVQIAALLIILSGMLLTNLPGYKLNEKKALA